MEIYEIYWEKLYKKCLSHKIFMSISSLIYVWISAIQTKLQSASSNKLKMKNNWCQK